MYTNNQPLNQQANTKAVQKQKVKFRTKLNMRGEIMHA